MAQVGLLNKYGEKSDYRHDWVCVKKEWKKFEKGGDIIDDNRKTPTVDFRYVKPFPHPHRATLW